MPRLTLQRKVFLAFATLLAALLLIFAAFSRLGLQRGLGPYVAEIELARMDWLAERLQRAYAQNGNWSALRDDPELWHRLQMDGTPPPDRTDRGGPGFDRGRPPSFGPPPFGQWPAGPPREGPGMRPAPQLDLLPQRYRPPPPPDAAGDPRNEADSVYRRLGLTDAAGLRIAGATVDAASAVRLPLRQGTQPVGYLVLAPVQGLGSEADRAFIAQQSRFMVFTGLAGLALALLLSWWLARRWFAPIGALMDGARGIAQGRLGTRIAARGQDELATLARSFNHMAKRLDGVEQSRRAWLADVSHELRTPVAALRAEIEALQDGIRPFDDRTALRLHRQVMRLGQLVDDLRLSMGDASAGVAGLMAAAQPLQPLALLGEAVTSMRGRFAEGGIGLDTPALDAPADAAPRTVLGDARRLHQVFMNLLENTLRYTDAGGTLRIEAQAQQGVDGRAAAELLLRFDDSAPGVGDDERALIFDRLYRGEGSRSRASGGSGLGLAICRSLVEAHGGRIEADASPLGGLRIDVTLPLLEEEDNP